MVVTKKEVERRERVAKAREVLKVADRQRLKKLIGSAIYKYWKENGKGLDISRDDLNKELLGAKNKPLISKFIKRVENLEMNDEDILSFMSILLTKSQIKELSDKPWTENELIPKARYDEILRYIKQNSTNVRPEDTPIKDVIKLIATKDFDEINKKQIMGINRPPFNAWWWPSERGKEPKEAEPKGKEPKEEEPKGKEPKEAEPKGKEPKEEEAIDIEVEVPVSPEKGKLSDIQKLREAEKREPEKGKLSDLEKMREAEKQKGEKAEGDKPEKGKLSDVRKLREAEKEKAKPERGSLKAMKRLREERQRSVAFKKVLDDISNNKQSQDKIKSQNIHIQNEIQKKLPALANSITDQQRHNIATIVQMKAIRAKAMGRGLELRNAINDATLRVTGKSVNQLKREEPISGQVKRFVGATQRKGSDVSKEEEEFAELSTNLIARMGGKQPEEMNEILLEVSADESDPMSDFARVYRENMDFLLQEDTPSGLSQSDLTATSSEEETSGTETGTETESTIEEGSETETKPITTKGEKKKSLFGTKLLEVAPAPSGVSTTKVKVPEDWSENKQAKGTLRPKFISPSVNVLQPSEQDIQADFDEWAIFDFVQPVNNYGTEGNLENNPLKRMSRVEEETIYRNAGIDLDPSLASVYTDREVNTSQQAMAMDMLPPLMPDTSSQPRQVYDVSEYEVKSYDVNNDRTQIEYQSPYDNMTPIVLTNDEVRRSVLYGRVP
jgi:hypothetical protein